MGVYVGIDPQGFKKKPDGFEYDSIKTRCIENYQVMDVNELAVLVGSQGHGMVPGKLVGGKKQKNCQGLQIFALDFDEGAKSKEIVERCRETGLDYAFIYHTFSSTAEHEKFRVVFISEKFIADIFSVKVIIEMLMKIFPECDKNCKNLDRIFNGGRELVDVNPDARIALVKLRDGFYHRIDKDNHLKRGLQTFSQKYRVPMIGLSLGMGTEAEKEMIFGENAAQTGYIFHYIDGAEFSPFFIAECPPDKPKFHSGNTRKERFRDLEVRIQNCRLLEDFINGVYLDHSQRFHICTNLLSISGGLKLFMNTLNEFYPESLPKWETDIRYMKGYYPSSCSEGACPYYGKCQDLGNIVNTVAADRHPVIVREEELYSIDEARSQLKKNIEDALHSNITNGMHLIKAQTSLGKTTMYTDLVAADTNLKVIIAVPTNSLKKQVYQTLIEKNVPKEQIFLTPSIADSPYIPEETKKTLTRYHDLGIHDQTGKILKRLISKMEPEADAAKKELQKIADGLKAVRGERIILTTHSYYLNVGETALPDYKVIVDEDILLLQIMPSINVTDIRSLEHIVDEQVPQYAEIAEKILRAEPEQYFRLDALQNGIDMETAAKKLAACDTRGNAYDLCHACAFIKERIDTATGNGRVMYFAPRALPKRSCIILSATLNESIYRKYFGSGFLIQEYVQKKARYRGRIIQYTYYSMGRTNLKNNPKIRNFLESINGYEKMPVITFKTSNILLNGDDTATDIHFGNTTGLNSLEGKDLIIVGTYFKVEQAYKLIGCCMGADANHDKRPSFRRCCYGSSSFYLTTYSDPLLQEIQMYSIGSEMEQAVGRARLIWYDSTVYLFSAFPVEQAELRTEDYLQKL